MKYKIRNIIILLITILMLTDQTITTNATTTTKESNVYMIKYTTTCVCVRVKPDTHSHIYTKLPFNTKVRICRNYNNKNWYKIKYKKRYLYISKKYVRNKKYSGKKYTIPDYKGFKSWMPYTAITMKSSDQYKLQQSAYTGNYGIRMIENRYCVAIGTHFLENNKVKIGTYFDLKLKNGTVIHCVLSDIKADRDTDSSNIFSQNKCCSEFLIDRSSLDSSAKLSGDVSSVNKSWNSPVKKIIIYKI